MTNCYVECEEQVNHFVRFSTKNSKYVSQNFCVAFCYSEVNLEKSFFVLFRGKCLQNTMPVILSSVPRKNETELGTNASRYCDFSKDEQVNPITVSQDKINSNSSFFYGVRT